MIRVLAIEDDPSMAAALRVLLQRVGFDVTIAGSGPVGWQMIEHQRPDAVLLDLSLPGLSGRELLRRLRARGDEVAVLAVTADRSTQSLTAVLELGADDYVAKPFRGAELIARLRAVLRRRGIDPATRPTKRPSPSLGPLTLNLEERRGLVADRPVALGPTELRLLEALLEQPGQLIPSAQIVRSVWGVDPYVDHAVLKVNVFRLRRKLDSCGLPWGEIRSVRGIGWGIFAVDGEPASPVI